MPKYSLYVKTHSVTGLKYLGQTSRNPFTYKGSGLYWRNHCKKHGNAHSTEVIGQYDNKEDLKAAGLYYSKLYNVTESEQWANLMPETGTSIFLSPESRAIQAAKASITMSGRSLSTEHALAISKSLQGRSLTDQHKLKLAESRRGKKHSKKTISLMRSKASGKKASPETIAKMRAAKLGKKLNRSTGRYE